MAVLDDLRQLTQENVIYLTRILQGQGLGGENGSSFIFRRRLHQALDSTWIFNTYVGSNGIAGINLGQQQDGWQSSERSTEWPKDLYYKSALRRIRGFPSRRCDHSYPRSH